MIIRNHGMADRAADRIRDIDGCLKSVATESKRKNLVSEKFELLGALNVWRRKLAQPQATEGVSS